MDADTPIEMLAKWLTDGEAGWSVGTFGAIAEFARDADEEASLDRVGDAIGVVTARGGLRLRADPDLRLVASETPTKESWSHRVALCLPQTDCAMSRRDVFSEVGPDREALRAQDCDGVLFDLGLSTLQVDVCIRSAEAGLTEALRKHTGRPIFAPDNDAMRLILAASPHRVFVGRIGRAEVFQPIPPPGGVSPDGPHTHLLPKLLSHGRTHAATEPLPDGWVPCAHLYPPHPLHDQHGQPRPFRSGAHTAFQMLLERYGDSASVALKQQAVEAVLAGSPPTALQLPDDRAARAVIRVALRQLRAAGVASDALNAWIAAWDRPGVPDDPIAPH